MASPLQARLLSGDSSFLIDDIAITQLSRLRRRARPESTAVPGPA
jgi:hypothetical protein